MNVMPHTKFKNGIHKKLEASALASLLLTGLLFFFSPISVYLDNVPEFDFQISELILFLFLPTLSAFIAVFLLLILLPQKWKLHQRIVALCIMLGLALWVQGNLLAWSHGVFDGESIDWDVCLGRRILDGALWISLFLISLAAYEAIYRNARRITLGLILLQLVGTVFLYSRVRQEEQNKSKYQLTNTTKFDFSKKNNILVVLIDTTEAALFRNVLNLRPEYLQKLDGFVFFPNNLSSYPSTLASIPEILTGNSYKNEQPFDQFKKKAYTSGSSLPKMLKKDGYDIFLESIYPRTIYIDPKITDNLTAAYASNISDDLLKYSLYRQLPILAKKYLTKLNFSINYFTLFSNLCSGHKAPEMPPLSMSEVTYPEDFSRYQDALNWSVRHEFNHFFNLHSPKPTFKFYHMLGTHRMNRAYCKAQTREESLISCFDFIFDIIQHLKDNGIYDNSTIVLLADHGARVVGKVDKENFNALLLVKPMNSSGPMKTSDRAMSLRDVAPMTYFISRATNEYSGILDKYFSLHPEPETRYIYHYIWHGWEKSYLPQLSEYSMTGSVESNELVSTGLSYIMRNEHEIDFKGEANISFSDKNNYVFLTENWNKQADGVTPLFPNKASIALPFSTPLSPNNAYHAEIVYALQPSPQSTPNEPVTNFTVKYGLSNYIEMPPVDGISTMSIPVRIYSRADRELQIHFLGPTNAQILIKSLSLYSDPPLRAEYATDYKLSTDHPENCGFLGCGWHDMEEYGTWAGAETQARLQMELCKPENDIVFQFKACAFLKEKHVERQRVGISVNGIKLRTFQITQQGEHTYQVYIPRDCILSNRLDMLFDLPDAAVPVEVGEMYGIRPLSMHISGFSVYELQTVYLQNSRGHIPYLKSGWHEQEPSHVWSRGQQAILEFLVGRPENNLEFVFRCKALLQQGILKKQRIIVHANGKELAAFEATTPEEKTYRVLIPQELLSTDLLEISFTLPDAISPEKLGINEDSRQIAIALCSFMLRQYD